MTVEEIAAAEKINASYVGRVLRLTLLGPDMVEMILNGQQSTALQLDRLLKPFPLDWKVQAHVLAQDAKEIPIHYQRPTKNSLTNARRYR